MVFYGYSVMKNPRVWGDQGRRAVKAEHFEEYCRQNGLFFLKAGCVVAVIGALAVSYTHLSSLCSSQRVRSFQQLFAGVCGTFQKFAAIGLDHAGIGKLCQLGVEDVYKRQVLVRMGLCTLSTLQFSGLSSSRLPWAPM